ncbi:MAG: Ig-like domain-containing protein [Gemmatimonadaceae bacterium]|nr:Ig-like domain-containing protein [Gemmatimonadaceae bacterium]
MTSIAIAAPSQLLSAIGETITMSATGKTAKGAAVGNLTFTWSSSNPGVATVANGLALRSGTAAPDQRRRGRRDGQCAVSVRQTASQVTVTFATDTIRAIGDTARAIAAARDSRGNPITGRTVTWTSGNPAVVTVDGNGLMTAIAEGSAIVRGVSGSAQGERTMQVRQRAARLIFLRQPSPARAGVAFTIQPQGELQDARGNRVSTDNATVVTASVGGTGGGGTVVSGATATANGGVVTFTVLAIGGPVGLKVLRLQAPSTSTASSEAFALSAGNPSTVIAASGNAQNGLAGNALPQPLVAGVRDAFGNPVAGVDMNFTVTQGTGTVNPAQAVTDANGNAATDHTLSRYAGNSTVTGA